MLVAMAAIADHGSGRETSAWENDTLPSTAVAATAAGTVAVVGTVATTTDVGTGTSPADAVTPTTAGVDTTAATTSPTAGADVTPVVQPWTDILPIVLRGLAMGTIIVAAVLGNILVIISVVRHRKLRVITNYYVVSLALADLLVALCAMTFNASVELTGRWLFGYVMCDMWNSLDVYFSTASILHLCCISVDRYYAIVRPLEYPLCMTRRTVVLMLAHVWLLPALISFTPIFLGWYTTAEHSEFRRLHPHVCAFVVNRAYAVISSSVSFWVPGFVMITMYFRIYKEAVRQKRALSRTSSHILLNSVVTHHGSSGSGGASAAAAALHQYQQALQRHRSLHVGPRPSPGQQRASVDSTSPRQGSDSNPSDGVQVVTVVTPSPQLPTKPSSEGVTAVGAATELNMNGTTISVRERQTSVQVQLNNQSHQQQQTQQQQQTSWRTEHKAARTLGVIMGAFLLCWLPFFLWYVITSLCGEACHCPDLLVSVLFWIGYTNSALNPLIYAYFNRDFREAFKDTLQTVFLTCWCRPEDESGQWGTSGWRPSRGRGFWKASVPTHYV